MYVLRSTCTGNKALRGSRVAGLGLGAWRVAICKKIWEMDTYYIRRRNQGQATLTICHLAGLLQTLPNSHAQHPLLVQLSAIERAAHAEAAGQVQKEAPADARADGNEDEHQVVRQHRARGLAPGGHVLDERVLDIRQAEVPDAVVVRVGHLDSAC